MTKRLSLRVIIAGAALGTLVGCGRTGGDAAAPAPTPVSVVRVEPQALDATTTYAATVVPDSQVTVAFRTAGYVDRLMRVGAREVQEGDVVAQGAVLAMLRQTDFATKVEQAAAQSAQANAALAIATAQHAEAAASLANAEVDAERAGRLFASQSVTKPEFDAAQTRLLAARARRDAAQGQIDTAHAQINAAAQAVREARTALDDSALKAPIGGVVLKKAVDVGSLAAPGAPAFVIANTRTVRAVFGIPDTDVASLTLGQALDVQSEATGGTVFRGSIATIAPAADARSRVFDVGVSMPNPNGQLKVGMIASVATRRGDRDGATGTLVVPLTAVVRSKASPDQYAVLLAESADGSDGTVVTARMREIRLGPVVNGGVSVLSGLAAGARVITAGSSLISDGERVEVVP